MLQRFAWLAPLFVAGCLSSPIPEAEPLPPPTPRPAPPDLTAPDPPPLFSGNVLQLDGGVAPLGLLDIHVRDGESEHPLPARVIFRPPPGAGFADSLFSGQPSPTSDGSAAGAMVQPDVVGSPEGVLLVHGHGQVPVPAGHYTLVVTRGPEYDLDQLDVDVQPGQRVPVHATLERVVDTGGWLAADMHVHLERSFDSSLPADRRVVSMVTNGVEVIVSTDHNVATDLAPVVAGLGYRRDQVGTVVGNEFNFWEGHGGAYPVPYFADQPGGGAPPWQSPNASGQCDIPFVGINCYHAADAFAIMHAQVPETTVVTVNHPFWPRGDLGYFTNVQWGAGTQNPPPALLDSLGKFDALEILNGYQTNDLAENSLLADWFFMIGSGFRVTALGNSDTHKINWVRGGWPRTWLKLPSDVPGDVDGASLAATIRAGRAVASTGPFVTLNVDGGDIGDTVRPQTPGQVTVTVTADAPPWIDIDELQLFVDGEEVRHFAVTPGGRPRFQAAVTLPLQQDAWIVALASSRQALPPDIVGECSDANGYEMRPWAVTNPIYVDLDGDGVWTPHLSPRRPPAPHAAGPPAPPEPLDGPVGQACDPSEQIGMEPPLDSPAHIAMPLLY